LPWSPKSPAEGENPDLTGDLQSCRSKTVAADNLRVTDFEQSIVPSTTRKPNILVVDDEEGVRSYLDRLLTHEGYTVTFATDGRSALASIAGAAPDVVLLDVNMPELSGLDVCRQLRRDTATRLTPIVLITASSEERIHGLDAGADDFLTKPIDIPELLARVRALVRLKQYTDDLDCAASIIMTLSTMIEARDGYSHGHCHRMANYATALGRVKGVGEIDLQSLYRGGFLHDIGMLAISDVILRKSGPLTEEEYALVRTHTTVGDTLCSNLRSLQSVRPIIRSHHEHLDGSGYPDGLRGDRIPLTAQIVGLVDVFEALTTPRPYQRPRGADEALAMLRVQADRGWHSHDLLEAFVPLIQQSANPAGVPIV
jgi:cyclic di-GMP phosphodiesterase